VVCTLGTTGGSSCHRLVHRSMQGLFKEVGLSPNFLWDREYCVPTSHLSYAERAALENAQMAKRVESIRAAQRGALPPSPVRLAGPAAPGSWAARARGLAAGGLVERFANMLEARLVVRL
jgi:hypothetical protein